MRDPLNLKQQEYNDIDIVKMNSVPKFDIEDYDLFDPKDMKMYLANLERIVRISFEYKQYISYLKENMDMNKCSFYENISNLDNAKVRIEIHHEPITLYDICWIVYNKRAYYREPLDEELVAKEVMILHYNLLVGLIPLSETVHDLVHNQYLFVPTTKVLGKYKEFVELYEQFIEPEQLDVLNRIEEYTLNYDPTDYESILNKRYIYIDFNYGEPSLSMEDTLSMIKDNIKKDHNLRQVVTFV